MTPLLSFEVRLEFLLKAGLKDFIEFLPEFLNWKKGKVLNALFPTNS